MKNIHKIVLTGGPCAGKTTALRSLQKHFSEKGFRVLCVGETASDYLSGGMSPFNMDNVTFQFMITSTMIFKESMVQLAAETVPEENVLIVCDRGQMDNLAYMTQDEFVRLQERMDTNIVKMRDEYEAVFHLETLAKASPDLYEKNVNTNAARYETAQDAIDTDNKTLSAWVGQPHLRIVGGSVDFDTKINRLLNEVESFIMGGLEIERKFLIKKPDTEKLKSMELCELIDIEQSYFEDANGSYRIRKRGQYGHNIYIRTQKQAVGGAVREEIETRISEDEAIKYMELPHTTLHKTRACIAHGGKYFELDMYPYSDEYALLEIELLSEDEDFTLPEFCEVVREVTDDKRYSNHSIAQTHKLDL
ncbi:MAG: AAA family ATPase [Clostridia bacterium]|nr:AAA family ATPase [Clostridia bacterium]